MCSLLERETSISPSNTISSGGNSITVVFGTASITSSIRSLLGSRSTTAKLDNLCLKAKPGLASVRRTRQASNRSKALPDCDQETSKEKITELNSQQKQTLMPYHLKLLQRPIRESIDSIQCQF